MYASILGTLCAAAPNRHGNEEEEADQWIISIGGERSEPSTPNNGVPSSFASTATAICPQVGMLVLGRVAKVVRPTQAMVDIVAIVPDEDTNQTKEASNNGSSSPSRPSMIIPLHEPFSGTLRQNEIRPNSSLEVNIEDCLRPGDVILARVHANGERDYILTTADAELGVIQAICESSGVEMQAVSWKEMECPVSKVREGRKVAKPRQIRVQ